MHQPIEDNPKPRVQDALKPPESPRFSRTGEPLAQPQLDSARATDPMPEPERVKKHVIADQQDFDRDTYQFADGTDTQPKDASQFIDRVDPYALPNEPDLDPYYPERRPFYSYDFRQPPGLDVDQGRKKIEIDAKADFKINLSMGPDEIVQALEPEFQKLREAIIGRLRGEMQREAADFERGLGY